MEMLKLDSFDEFERLDTSLWGIRQHFPNSKVTRLDKPLDLIFVPGVAFSECGKRLGHGKGYYDQFFHEYHKKSPNLELKKVALALIDQIVPEVPVEEHDVILDQIIHA